MGGTWRSDLHHVADLLGFTRVYQLINGQQSFCVRPPKKVFKKGKRKTSFSHFKKITKKIQGSIFWSENYIYSPTFLK
jgi:hypothetical protein